MVNWGVASSVHFWSSTMRNLFAFVLMAFIVASMAQAKSIESESGSDSISDESYSLESGSESAEDG